MIMKEEGENRYGVLYRFNVCILLLSYNDGKEGKREKKFNICTNMKTSLSVVKSQIPLFGRVTLRIVNI